MASLKESPLHSRTMQRPPRRLPARTRQAWFAAHQLELAAVPIGIILMLNAGLPPRTTLRFLHPLHLPSINPTVHLETLPPKFLYISYVNPDTGLCLKGGDDAYLLLFWFLVWTAARDALMRYVWTPLAKALGAPDQRSVQRFAEQGWTFAYALMSWSAGMYIWWYSPFRSMSAEGLFAGYPHFTMAPFTKFYYLAQIAFWLQQLVALNIEAKRKDYRQMLTHHFVTIFLVIASYSTNFVRVGNAVFVTMDFADFILALAKMLQYLGWQTACDNTFGVFVLAWFLTRHVIYGSICYSALFRSRDIIGPWRWEPAAGWFWSKTTWVTFNVALLSLQVIIFYWSDAIARLTWKALRGTAVEDSRSDDEIDPCVLDFLTFFDGLALNMALHRIAEDDDDDHFAPHNDALQLAEATAVAATNGSRPEDDHVRRRRAG